MSRPVDVASQLQALGERGVTNPQEFASLDAETIATTIQWFDAQNGRVAAGVLVQELRSGGRKLPSKQDLAARQAQYGQDVIARLSTAMPEMIANGQPHPAAFLALSRGISTPSAVRRFVRSWIVEHEQQPGAAYETPDAAYWWSVVGGKKSAA